MTLTRSEFLKMCGGFFSTAFIIPGIGVITHGLERNFPLPETKDESEALTGLMELQVEAPEGTEAVRFYMDNIQLSELTDFHAKKTKTKPVWKTIINLGWFEPGEHRLQIKVDTSHGIATFEDRKLATSRISVPDNRILLTGAWQFASQDDLPTGAAEGVTPIAAQLAFNDGNWTAIMVPNSLGYVSKRWNKFEGILGVYRRIVEVNSVGSEEQFAIVLESCYWLGRVFMNGNEVGLIRGGFLSNRFDITKYIRSGDNLISVIVDSRLSKVGIFNVSGGGYWNWGGLLQEVYIARTSKVSLIDVRTEGTHAGKLTLRADGVNGGNVPQDLEAFLTITDPAGNYVLRDKRVTFSVPNGGDGIKPFEVQINHPALWGLEHPNLYTITLRGEWEEVKERTGFRDVCVSDGDILLNGKVVEDLQGFNRHSDYPGLGKTQPTGLARRELKELYDKGFRIFRPAHYPTTPDELDAADELVFFVMEQVEIVGLTGAQLALKEAKDFAAQQLARMIYRDRCHPSIIAWSIGNENRTDQEGAEEYIRDTIRFGKSLDPTRLFTQVSDKRLNDRKYRYQDFVAQNFYAGWYDKGVDSVVTLIDSLRPYAGNKPVLLSEYGAEAVIGRPGTNMGTKFYQGFIVDSYNRLLNKRKHFLGKLYWTFNEFWCTPAWAGGSPDSVSPFHVKGLRGYYRNYDKLGWRVMFSPIRLSVHGPLLEQTELGASTKVSNDEKVKFDIEVTIHEVWGEKVSGELMITSPDGFHVTPIS